MLAKCDDKIVCGKCCQSESKNGDNCQYINRLLGSGNITLTSLKNRYRVAPFYSQRANFPS